MSSLCLNKSLNELFLINFMSVFYRAALLLMDIGFCALRINVFSSDILMEKKSLISIHLCTYLYT